MMQIKSSEYAWLAGVAVLGTLTVRAQASVTFTKDVAPILQRACQNCHRPDSIAPMSLLTCQEARPWAALDQRESCQAGHAAMVH